MTLEAIKYSRGSLEILDQLLLPIESKYIPVKNTEGGWQVIKKMQVRGAPAIGIVAAYSLAVELNDMEFTSSQDLLQHVKERFDYLITARPTAVNILTAKNTFVPLLQKLVETPGSNAEEAKESLLVEIEKMQKEDVAMNRAMGSHGADHIVAKCDGKPVTVLTHCNTGSLATGGFGTALGVVRMLHERDLLERCYCTETRPYNQGSRLTAYELVHDKIPSTLICDSMVAMLMRTKQVSAVFLGADRIVANGDTANKIGTLQLAVLAKHHGVPFYTVAPSTSIDLNMESGSEIVIEERPAKEMKTIKGIPLAPEEIEVWNPAFDVTPAELITGGIVTEFGVFTPSELKAKLSAALSKGPPA